MILENMMLKLQFICKSTFDLDIYRYLYDWFSMYQISFSQFGFTQKKDIFYPIFMNFLQ